MVTVFRLQRAKIHLVEKGGTASDGNTFLGNPQSDGSLPGSRLVFLYHPLFWHRQVPTLGEYWDGHKTHRAVGGSSISGGVSFGTWKSRPDPA